MATTLNVVRTLTIRSKTEGVDQSSKELDKLSGSMDKTAASSKKLADVTDSSARKQLSMAQSAKRFEQSLDPAAKAADRMKREIDQLNKFQEAGHFSSQRAAQLLDNIKSKYSEAGAGARVLAKASQELGSTATGLASSLGAVGSVAGALGPIGLAIAAAIAVVTLGFAAAAHSALEFADAMGKLVDSADTLGLTVDQLRALQLAAAQVGIDAGALDGLLEKFSVSLEKVREGSEKEVNALERLQQGLAGSVQNAKTMDEALTLVFKAMQTAEASAARLSAREIFGKQGLAAIRLAGTDINALVANMNDVDKAAVVMAKSIDAVGDSINENLKLAGTNVKSVFALPVLDVLDEVTKILLELSRTFATVFGTNLGGFFDPAIAALQEFRAQIQTLNQDITAIGANQAFINLGERLFGTQVNAAIRLFLTALQLVAQNVVSLISLFVSLGTAIVRAFTFNWSGVTAAFEDASNTVRQMGANLLAAGQSAATLGPQIISAGNAVANASQETSNANLEWNRYVIQINAASQEADRLTQQQAKVPPALGRSTAAVKDNTKALKDNNDIMKELGQVAGQLGSALVSAFLKGENAGKAFKTTLQSISSQAAGTAINKLVTGDFTGAAVSGGISLVSGLLSSLFGDDEEDKRNQEEVRRQQAESAALVKRVTEAWAAMADELAAFERQAQGMVDGALRKSIDAVNEQTQSFIDTAAAAGSAAGTAQAAAAGLANINRVLTEFFKQIDAAISEFGEFSFVLQARADVKQLADEFKGLTADIIEFGVQTGDAVGTAERLARLQAEGLEGFMHLLDVSDPLSDVEKQVGALKARADALTEALIELGYSAEVAAATVTDKLNKSLQQLRTDFFAPLIEDINDFVGAGWINDLTALQKQVAQLRTDAAALGVDTAMIDTWYVIQAQKIINENELVGLQFQTLARALGIAEGSLHEFVAEVEDAGGAIARTAAQIAQAIQTNEDRLALALHRSDSLADQLFRFDLAAQREREAEIAAGGQAIVSLEAALAQERLNIINDFLAEQARIAQEAADRAAEEAERVRQEQIEAARRAAEERARALQEATEFIQGQVRRINDWINNFLAGPQSTLPPSQQLSTAQSFFASEYAAAAAGNRDALSNITNAAQTLVDATRRYYGSSATGQGIITNLLNQLRTLPGMLTPEEFIVQGLTTPIDNLGTTVTTQTTTQTNTLTSVLTTLLNNLKAAVDTGNAQAIAAALLPLFNTLDTTMDQALSFAEFQAGLGATYATGTLRSIFNELDGNGNGLLEKSELIKVATQGTDTKTTTTNSSLDVMKSQLTSINNAVINLVEIQSRIAETNGYLAAMRQMMQWQNLWWGVQERVQLPQYERGGPLYGARHGQGGVPIMAEGGEYIMSRKSVSAIGVPALNTMNFRGGDLFSAIKTLELSLMRGIRALIETQLETAGVIARPMHEANKLSKTRRGEKKVA